MTYEFQTANQAGQNQLDLVAAEFKHWRHHKKSGAEKVPESLLREAQKLTAHLGVTAVRRRLGITKAQMDRLNPNKQAQAPKASEFMQLMPTDAKATARPPHLSIDICTPKGVKISLSGLSQQDPLALIAKLIEG